MRVDIGIILSVLSFSVLAKVIPNDDFHGSLLVRRAVGPDTTDLLWKRADGDDKQGPSPMDSTTGADADAGASSYDSSPDHPSGSGELSELDQTSDSAEELYRPSQEHLLPHRQRYILRSDKESIQKAVKKVTEAFEGENKEEFVTEVEVLLTHVLSSTKRSLDSYNSQTSTLFFLSIPDGTTDQQSLTKEMHGIHKSGNYIVKEFLRIVKIAICRITQTPRKMMKELRGIKWWTTYMRNFIISLRDSRYATLVSKVGNPENEAYVEVTKAYIHQMENDWDLALELLKKIESMVDSGVMRPRTISSKVSSLTSNVKKCLGINDEPPAYTTTD